MVATDIKDIMVVIYCFENDIDLPSLLDRAKEASTEFADAKNVETLIIGNNFVNNR